jgi:streptogramin lyase
LGEITEFPLPTPSSGPAGIATGPDGALWFTEQAANKIGRITTWGEIIEFSIPTPGSKPLSIVAGIDGNLYFTEVVGNKIGGITASGTIMEFPIPTAASSPLGIASGLDGAIWFTEFEVGKIGRLSLGPVTCEPDTMTMCLNAGRFRVSASWRRPDGTTGLGHAVPLTPDSGYFWFFDAANIELVVKVLDGCGITNSYWVFAAGLTNVEVFLTVVDSQTGIVAPYLSEAGTAFQPIQDTAAFECR